MPVKYLHIIIPITYYYVLYIISYNNMNVQLLFVSSATRHLFPQPSANYIIIYYYMNVKRRLEVRTCDSENPIHCYTRYYNREILLYLKT